MSTIISTDRSINYPDNFIEGETLRNAILKVQPNLKGQIDRFGGTPDGEVRYMIGPYKLYKQPEIQSTDRCAQRQPGQKRPLTAALSITTSRKTACAPAGAAAVVEYAQRRSARKIERAPLKKYGPDV